MRLLLAVKSCQKDKRDGVHQAIRETWGKVLPEGVDLLFFVGGKDAPVLEKDERHLRVPDGYWELPEKTIAILRYAVWKDYDFSCLCDTDTYLDLFKLMRSGFDFYDYSGAPLNPSNWVLGKEYPKNKTEHPGFVTEYSYAYLSGGHGYILSKKAAKIVAASSVSSHHDLEDLMIGQILGPFISSEELTAKVLPKYQKIASHLGCGYFGSRYKVSEFNRLDVSYALRKKHEEVLAVKDSENRQMKTALVVIAAGEMYWPYAEALIASAKRFFIPHDVFLFTDRPVAFGVKKQITIPSMGFTMATLMRYHWILTEQEELSQYENIFYCDADMLFIAPVTEKEVLSNGITVVEHPGYLDCSGGVQHESNPLSMAYLEKTKKYFAGGFNGGTSVAYLKMAKAIQAAVNTDLNHRIIAKWFDESHLNRYCYDNPPAKILTPAFCYPHPEQDYPKRWAQVRGDDYPDTIVPKLLALEKTPEERIARGSPE